MAVRMSEAWLELFVLIHLQVLDAERGIGKASLLE